jgi:hypothetical protein
MLPPVTHVSSVEMIRDGGSLAAIFGGGDGSQYWLFFPVLRQYVGPDHSKISGWHLPEIRERSTGLKSQLSWQHAKTFIAQLKAHVDEERQIALLNAMSDVANAEGSITPSIEAVFPSIGGPARIIRPPKKPD